MRLTDAAPYYTVSATAQKHLETDIAEILQEAQALGVTYAQAMVGTQEASVGQVAQGIAERAKGIIQTILDHIRNALFGAVQKAKEEPEPVSVQDTTHEAMTSVQGTLPDLVSSYEVHSAIEDSVLQQFEAQGVAYVEWMTEPDACDDCTANKEQGPIATGAMFQSGHKSPPGHGRCRCHLIPSKKE